MIKKNKEILNKLAENLKLERKKANLSQERLANLSKLDRTYISMIERSLKNPSLLTLKKLSSSLKINITDLVKDI